MNPTMMAWHRWLGLVMGLVIVVSAFTALGRNHHDLFDRAIPASAGPFARTVMSVAVDPKKPENVLLGTDDGLFRSADSGKTFEEVVLPVPAERVTGLLF